LLSEKNAPKEELKHFPALEKHLSLPEELKKPRETISHVTINPSTRLATFAYISDAKNPPLPEGEKIYLVGELTKGKFIELLPSVNEEGKTLYACKLKVEPGYKYTFCFKIGDTMVNDAHYPIYITKYGQKLNWIHVSESPKDVSSHPLTFVDNTILAYERKKLESLYSQVINAVELPKLKELNSKVGNYYYAAEEPYGLMKLKTVSIESMWLINGRW
jgi:hypothetical protein